VKTSCGCPSVGGKSIHLSDCSVGWHEKKIGHYAELVKASRIGCLFENKKLRDEVYRVLTKEGVRVKRHLSRNQEIHPQYVTDWKNGFQTGFGNTDYKTFFGSLYGLEVVR
jgi:hypothetical protein